MLILSIFCVKTRLNNLNDHSHSTIYNCVYVFLWWIKTYPLRYTMLMGKVAKDLIFIVTMMSLFQACQEKEPESACETFLQSPQINTHSLRRHIETLSHDNMYGRWIPYGGEIKASEYIRDEMSKIGLTPLTQDYLVPFAMYPSTTNDIQVSLNDKTILVENLLLAPLGFEMQFSRQQLTAIINFHSEISFQSQYKSLIDLNNTRARNANILVLVPEKHKEEFKAAQKSWEEVLVHKENLYTFSQDWPKWVGGNNILFILTGETSVNQFSCSYKFPAFNMYNVVGVLPGKSKPEEVIIFGAHFDHLGVFPGLTDSIFNGANDNASGVAAILAIAEYYISSDDNERTLWFVGFNAEEVGLFGSKRMATDLQSQSGKIKAMFNLDMVGNTMQEEGDVYLVGYQFTNAGKRIKTILECSNHKILDDSKITSFNNRMDHRSFREIGVLAHSFTTYSGDNFDPYHTSHDEIDLLDFNALIKATQAILLATKGYVDGSL